MALHTLRCNGCHHTFDSDESINQTVWDAQAQGWDVNITDYGEVIKVLCPDDHESEPTWVVECRNCDWSSLDDEDDSFIGSEKEAKQIGQEHDCRDFLDPFPDSEIVITSPEQQRKDQARFAAAMEKGQQRSVAAHEKKETQAEEENTRYRRDRLALWLVGFITRRLTSQRWRSAWENE